MSSKAVLMTLGVAVNARRVIDARHKTLQMGFLLQTMPRQIKPPRHVVKTLHAK
jgi:hypothetical protein